MMNHIDDPHFQDNRNYNYSETNESERLEHSIITDLLSDNSTAIDLGCGNGILLEKLISKRRAKCKGIEISDSAVELCRKKGLDVSKGKIDEKLPFDDNSFDYSICNVTIQMVNYPEVLLGEMKRISKFQVISFPNFAFYKNRLDLLLNGKMPRPMLFGYKWYNTGHMHQLSIKDFYELLDNIGGMKIREVVLQKSKNPLKNYLMKSFPNLFQVLPVFLTEK